MSRDVEVAMVAPALSGIRVVETAQMVAGPYCARLFADAGADVVKVEPAGGDASRSLGPFPGDQPDPEKSGLFFHLNSGKKSVVLDLETAAGRDSLRGLVASADVLVDDHPPAELRRLGLTYAELSALNPDLVMISITPFGQTGPYADWKGYDLNSFHLSGSSSRYLGRPGDTPLEPGTFAADYMAGAAGAAWGLGAVAGRNRVGRGQQVDVSAAEVSAALFTGALNITTYRQTGIAEKRSGQGMTMTAPAGVMATKDGYVWMLAVEPHHWEGLVRAMGSPDWMTDPGLAADMFARGAQAEMVYERVGAWLAERTSQEVMDICQANGVPTTAIMPASAIAGHPHLAERRFVETVDHPGLGTVRRLGVPFRLAEDDGVLRGPAPRLGADTAAVLSGPDPRRRRPLSPMSHHLPLSGVRVANFGWVWAGPVVGQTLSMLGAEVYKIESNARVDVTRRGIFPQPAIPPALYAPQGSVSLNMKQPEAVELAREIIAMSDVVIENYGPGTMAGWGLSYEEVRAIKPDIVYLAMPAAGSYGPMKGVITYGMTLASICGLDALTGYLGQGPQVFEQAYTDPYNGLIGTFAVLSALRHRDRTGRGQRVEYSQQEAALQMAGQSFMEWFLNQRDYGPMENRHPTGAAAPHGVFPAAGGDRWIAIACCTDEEWRSLVTAMGSPEWAANPAYATAAGRVADIDIIHAFITEWTSRRDDYGLAALLQEHGVAATPVLDVADLFWDPHFRARGTWTEHIHPREGRGWGYGAYVKLSETDPHTGAGPWIGDSNDYVFRELLRLPPERYRDLVDRKVIF
jgi:benzylsuccinate CoA-transferase BbsF subunit